MTIGNRDYNTLSIQELRQLKDETWVELDKIDAVIRKKKEDRRATLEERLLDLLDEIFANGYSIGIYDPDEEYDGDDDDMDEANYFDNEGNPLPTREYGKEEVNSGGVRFSVT